jgi:hypothetical protein
LAAYVKPSELAMLDKAEKTYQLLATLKAAAPFEVELTPSVIAHLRTQQIAVKPQQIVTEISYAGDEGGIVCHMAPEEGRDALIVSLTHVRAKRSLAFAAAVLDYQKHRLKKLKKQNRA